MPKVLLHCHHCGKPYLRFPSQVKRSKYCSRKCLGTHVFRERAKKFHITKTCPICGQEFQTTTKNGGKKTCSKKCADVLRTQGVRARPSTRIMVACTNCGKLLKRPPSRVDGRTHFCNQDCKTEHQRIPESKVILSCKTCGQLFTVTRFFTSPHLGRKTAKYCSRACMAEALSHNRRRENNPNWKGGYVLNYGPNWYLQRRKALKRDNHACQVCNYKIGGDIILDVHHIIPFKQFNGDWKSANQLTNLISLCRVCHPKVECGELKCPKPG